MGFYSCADSTSKGYDTFSTTSDGAKTARVWTPIYASGSTGVALPQSLHTNQAMISYLVRTVTIGSGVSSAANSASTASSSAQSSSSKTSSSHGPIAGGVGGGIAAVALIGVVFMLLTRRKRPAASERLPDTRDGDGGHPTAAQQMAAVAAERAREPRYSYQDDFPAPGGHDDAKHSFAETLSIAGSDAGHAAVSVASLSPPLHVADLCNDSVSSLHSARSTRPPSQQRRSRQQQQSSLASTSGVIPVGISELPERTSREVAVTLDLPPPLTVGVQYANRNSDVLELTSLELKTPMVHVAVPLVLSTATPVELDGTSIVRPDRSRDGSRQPSRQPSRAASRERKPAQSARQSTHQPSPPPMQQPPSPPSARRSVQQSVQQPPPQSARQSVQQPPPQSARQSVQQPPPQSARQSMQPPVPQSARQSMQPPVPQSARQSMQPSVPQSARQSMQPPVPQSARQSMQPPVPQSARQSVQQPLPPSARQSIQQSARQSVQQSARESARQSMEEETSE